MNTSMSKPAGFPLSCMLILLSNIPYNSQDVQSHWEAMDLLIEWIGLIDIPEIALLQRPVHKYCTNWLVEHVAMKLGIDKDIIYQLVWMMYLPIELK